MRFHFIAILSKPPEWLTDGILLSDDESEGEMDTDDANLVYAILCRTSALSSDQAREFVEEGLIEKDVTLAESLIPLNLGGASFTRREKKSLAKLDDGDVSIHSMFLAFNPDDADRRHLMREIIQNYITKRRWQFWR